MGTGKIAGRNEIIDTKLAHVERFCVAKLVIFGNISKKSPKKAVFLHSKDKKHGN